MERVIWREWLALLKILRDLPFFAWRWRQALKNTLNIDTCTYRVYEISDPPNAVGTRRPGQPPHPANPYRNNHPTPPPAPPSTAGNSHYYSSSIFFTSPSPAQTDYIFSIKPFRTKSTIVNSFHYVLLCPFTFPIHRVFLFLLFYLSQCFIAFG